MNPKIPILTMSSSNLFKHDALRSGADEFLMKPFLKSDLDDCIKKLLLRKKETDKESFERFNEQIEANIINRNPKDFMSETLRAMVVDDSAVSLKIVGKLISELGYDGDLFYNGQQALQHLEKCADHNFYDVIITDINMPGDGDDLKKYILHINLVNIKFI